MIYIVKADLDENALKDVQDKINGWVSAAGGQILKVDLWGKRRLAYPIRKQTEGVYVMNDVQMAPSFSAELERNLRFLEPVMRFLITVK